MNRNNAQLDSISMQTQQFVAAVVLRVIAQLVSFGMIHPVHANVPIKIAQVAGLSM